MKETNERVAAKVLRTVEWSAADGGAKPDISFLPMLDRRRLSPLECAAMHVAWKLFSEDEGLPRASGIPVVFSSRWGEIGVTAKLMRQMHEDGEMSPAGFSSSVHNAAPGAWSLFTKNRAAYTAIAARDRSYDMGLLEAESQIISGSSHVLYVYAEESTPECYLPEFGRPVVAHAVAMLLAREIP